MSMSVIEAFFYSSIPHLLKFFVDDNTIFNNGEAILGEVQHTQGICLKEHLMVLLSENS